MPDSQKKIAIVAALLILLAAVYVFGFSARPVSAPAVGQQPPGPTSIPAPSAANVPSTQPAASTPVQPSAAPAEKPAAEPNTQAMLLALSNNFKDVLTAAKFPVAGALHIDRVWLVGSQSSYVEYTDAGSARRVLVEVTALNPFKFKGQGYFEPGDNDWVLTKGQDKIFKDQAWTLYKFDPVSGAWQKQN